MRFAIGHINDKCRWLFSSSGYISELCHCSLSYPSALYIRFHLPLRIHCCSTHLVPPVKGTKSKNFGKIEAGNKFETEIRAEDSESDTSRNQENHKVPLVRAKGACCHVIWAASDRCIEIHKTTIGKQWPDVREEHVDHRSIAMNVGEGLTIRRQRTKAKSGK